MSKFHIVGLLIAVLILIVLGGLFMRRSTVPATTDEFVVATTLFPLADMVRNVTGPDVEVVQLIPAGADPHSYTLTPQLVAASQRADVLFIIGHGIDDHIADSLTKIVTVPVVVVDAGIALREFSELHSHDELEATDEHGHEDSGVDPHYWLTAPNAQVIAATVARELAARDAARAAAYNENLARYMQQLEALEAELQDIRRSGTQRYFIAMHNAWSYFAEHYNLELVATYEPIEGRTPSLEDLGHLREEIAAHNIRVFYAEPQRASTAATQFFAKEFGLTILTLNAEGALAKDYSYVQLMRDNMQAIAAGS